MLKLSSDVPPDMADDCVLSLPQMSKIAGCSPDTIRRAAARGELKLTRLSARRIGSRKGHFRQWLRSAHGLKTRTPPHVGRRE